MIDFKNTHQLFSNFEREFKTDDIKSRETHGYGP